MQKNIEKIFCYAENAQGAQYVQYLYKYICIIYNIYIYCDTCIHVYIIYK